MRRLVPIGFIAASLLVPEAASASTFDFSYLLSSSFSDFSVAASGVLTTADAVASDGSVQITSISGSRTVSFGGSTVTQTILGLFNPDPAYQADFKLFPSQTIKLDMSGFTFTVDGAGDDFGGHVNVSYFADQGRYIEPIELGFDRGTFTVTPTSVSAVPLPASAPMFGAALLALGTVAGAARFRRRRAI